jgi:hypothetical protein
MYGIHTENAAFLDTRKRMQCVSVDFAQYQIQDGNSLRRFAVDNSTGMIYTVGELLYSSVGTSVSVETFSNLFPSDSSRKLMVI